MNEEGEQKVLPEVQGRRGGVEQGRGKAVGLWRDC